MADRIVKVPAGLESLADAFDAVVADVQGTMARTRGGKAVNYAEVEAAVADDAAMVERGAHKSILQALDINVPAVIIGGVRYTRVGRCSAPYHSMAGSVSVERSLYRRSGARGGTAEGKVVDAVSLRVGAVEGWLPCTARAMAHAVQQGTSREAEASACEQHRLPYSRASFESLAHVVGAMAVAAHQDVEDVLIDSYTVPGEARSVSASLDRVSVPMEEPVPRPVGRPRKNAPKNPVKVKYHMAYCGTVTLHDENGEALHTIRYGCMPEGDIEGLRDRLVADVATLVAKRPDLTTELLCDGAPEMWNLLEAGFTEERFGTIHRLVDLHHLKEKLAAAAQVIHGEAAPAARTRWSLNLLNRNDAAQGILSELVASGKDEGPGEDHPVHAAITYLQSHSVEAERMNYARARRTGLPLGSGNVEATCKSLFELRMKRCGARWKEETGEHIVQLRALALSDRWGHAIELILRPLAMAVRAA